MLVAGGVAANSRLRAVIEQRAEAQGVLVRIPRPGLCTDNGAMVAALGAALVEAHIPPTALNFGADSSFPVDRVVR